MNPSKNQAWEASLISPQEMVKFVTRRPDWNEVVPLLDDKFVINRIEDYRQFMPMPMQPHRKPVYDFVFITQGTTIRNKGIDAYEVQPNSFFFLPAYQILTGESMSEDIKGFYCHFDMDIFNDAFIQKDILNSFPFLQYASYPIVKIPESETPSVLSIIHRLETTYKNGANKGLDVVASYLLTLFLEIKPYVSLDYKKTLGSAVSITQHYKAALAHHIYEFHKVSDFAKLLSISPNHLNRCVQATTGKSAQEFLLEMLLLEAKVLLKHTSLSINQIAYKLGKKEHADFSRLFKSKTGMTPKEYRDS